MQDLLLAQEINLLPAQEINLLLAQETHLLLSSILKSLLVQGKKFFQSL